MILQGPQWIEFWIFFKIDKTYKSASHPSQLDSWDNMEDVILIKDINKIICMTVFIACKSNKNIASNFWHELTSYIL